MKEYKRRRSLSGAVLIMILTVMFVLIILLTATLTTVTTANQRIYTKFEENQAYYTARSALDVFTMNMLDDGDYVATKADNVSTIDYDYTKPDGTNDTVPMKQGLALQLDLYMLKPQSGFQSVDQNDLKTFVTNTTDTKLKLKQYEKCYGTDSSKVQNNGKPVTDPEYAEYIEYEVELPQLEDGSNKYGKLSDKESNIPKAKIKVELLERTYDIGSYDISSYTDKEDFFENGSASDKAEAVVSGNRENDTMRVKITATTTFDGVDGIAVLILDNTKPVVPNGTRAITTFGNTKMNNMTIVGGVASQVDVEAGNTGDIVGDVFIDGNFKNDNGGSSFQLIEEQCMYIGGSFTAANSFKLIGAKASVSKDERPFVYIAGDGMGNAYNAKPGVNQCTNDKDGDTTYYDLLINGDMNFGTENGVFNHNGDIYVTGNINFSTTGQRPVINGSIYAGGTVTYALDGDGNALAPIGTSVTEGAAVSFADKDTSTSDVIDIILPGSVKKSMPTDQKIYSEHYLDNDMTKSKFTAEDLYFVSDEDRKNGVNVPTTNTFESIVSGATEVYCRNGGVYKSSTESESNKYPKNATYTDYYELTDGTYYIDNQDSQQYKFFITGSEVNLIFKPGTFMGDIIVDDTTKVKVSGSKTKDNYTFQNFKMAGETIYNAITNSGTSLYVGQSGTSLIAPKIYWFFGKDSNLSIENGSIIAAYVQSPEAIVALKNRPTVDNVVYNDVNIGTKGLSIIGSLLCGDMLAGHDHGGVAYINPNVPSVNPGEPIHNFETFQYVRS